MDFKSSYLDLVSCLNPKLVRKFLKTECVNAVSVQFESCIRNKSRKNDSFFSAICSANILPTVLSRIVFEYLPELFAIVLRRYFHAGTDKNYYSTHVWIHLSTTFSFQFTPTYFRPHDYSSTSYLSKWPIYFRDICHNIVNSIPYISDHDELLIRINTNIPEITILNIETFLEIMCTLLFLDNINEALLNKTSDKCCAM